MQGYSGHTMGSPVLVERCGFQDPHGSAIFFMSHSAHHHHKRTPYADRMDLSTLLSTFRSGQNDAELETRDSVE